MVRRKKSLLFSLSLASAGLVAGALFATAPKTQASNNELSATVPDMKIQAISESVNMPAETVKSSLKTHKLIIEIADEKELDENEDIVDYKKVADGVYVVTFKDYDATSENYIYYRDSNKADSISLNMPMEIQDNSFVPISMDGKYNIPEVDKCLDIDSSSYTYTGFTRWPDQCLAWGNESMKMMDYAKSITSANKVKVAVIDTGITATHLAFGYNSPKDRLDMTLAYDYYDNDSDPDDSQNISHTNDDGTSYKMTHGTSVAGAITESTPFNVKVVPVRINNGAEFRVDNVLEAVSALKGKVDIINLSLGSTNEIKTTDVSYSVIDRVMKEAKEAGTIIVAAAGNNGNGYVSWPAMSAYTIAVGSVNQEKNKSDFSQYGNEIDFTAPGEGLLLPAGGDDSALTCISGTSFSTPFISAAVANILSEHPDYSFNDVYNALKLNAEDLGTSGKDEKFGWGSVSFHINKFADLNIADNSNNNAWTNSAVALDISTTSNAYNITHYTLQSGNTTKTQPSSWTAIETPGKTATINKSVSENGTYTLWVKNSNNEIKAKTLTINNIDKTAPIISTAIDIPSSTDTSATLSIGVTDTNSGLAKIVWHYKLEDADNYTDKAEVYATTGTGATTATTKTFTIENLEKGNYYSIYATVYDMAGNSKDSHTILYEHGVEWSGEQQQGGGGGEDNPTTPTNNNKPKPVSTNGSGIKNPKTADLNLARIAGISILLSTTAFFIFRTKRR